MKKCISVALALVMVFALGVGLAGCGDGHTAAQAAGVWSANVGRFRRQERNASLMLQGNQFEVADYQRYDEWGRWRDESMGLGWFSCERAYRELVDMIAADEDLGLIELFSVTTQGTFSLSNDGRIEFLCGCGGISVQDFSRTENTMTIGRANFTRER